MNTQEYIEYLLKKQLYNNQDNQQNVLNKYKNGLDTVNSLGQNLQTAGDYLQGVNNQPVNTLGSGLSKAGSFLQNATVPKFTGFSAQTQTPAIQEALSDALGSAGINAGTAGTSAGASAFNPLITLGVMAINGTNRNGAEKESNQLLEHTNKMANAVANDTSTQDFANNVVANSRKGIATGLASPIDEPSDDAITQGSVLNTNMPNNSTLGNVITPNINNAITTSDLYNAPVDNNMQTGSVSENNTEKVKNGLLSKFMNGVSDFAKGYQENRNTGYSPDNFNQERFAGQTTTYTPNQQLVDYQNSLRDNQDFIKWANNAQKDKEAVLNDIANGKNGGYAPIDEWIKANPDALKPVANIQTTYTGKEKGKMARFGEGVGTLARMLQNPNFQGLVAGGLGTVLTGNPLYGLGLGYKMANQRAMSEAYRNILKQNGINVPDIGTFGNVTSTDMKNIGTLAEAHNWHQYLNQAKLEELARKKAHDEVLKEHYTNQDKARQQMADARTTSAQASLIKANKTGAKGSGAKSSGKGGSKTPKPNQHPDWNNDLAGYIQRLNDPRYATKIGQLKAMYIKKYGVDPDKYIKE